jgi:hypothetical protein
MLEIIEPCTASARETDAGRLSTELFHVAE